MSDQSTKEFNQRLSQWVASQGIWFQLRYSIPGESMRGRILVQLMGLGLKLLLLVLLAGLVFWGYLYKRAGSEAFADSISETLESQLAAAELDLREVSYADDRLMIARIAAEGGPATFFESLIIYNVSSDIGLLETFFGGWSDGGVRIGELDIFLRAGANDPQAAAEMGQLILGASGARAIDSMVVARANIQWGFSHATQGGIEDSRMLVQRHERGWKLTFEGGRFSQNWLRDMEIVELVAVCGPDGIVFEKGEFTKGEGTVQFSQLKLESGYQPKLDGEIQLRDVDLVSLLPASAIRLVDGTISGDFGVFGSTNTPQGVGYEGRIRLGNGCIVSLKDTIPMLEALSVLDYTRRYHRLDFQDGGFDLRMESGSIEVSNIAMEASKAEGEKEPKIVLGGAFKTRLPNKEELRQAIEDDLIDKRILPLGYDLSENIDFAESSKDQAALIAQGFSKPDPRESALFNRLNQAREFRQAQAKVSGALAKLMQYEGELIVSLPGTAFERAGQLRELYPVNAESGRIEMKVPTSGLLEELTVEQSEDMYAKGRRP